MAATPYKNDRLVESATIAFSDENGLTGTSDTKQSAELLRTSTFFIASVTKLKVDPVISALRL